MKTLALLVFSILTASLLYAQKAGPIPELSKQLNQYFSYFPTESVSLITDKLNYKPGETIWFSAFATDENQQPVSPEIQELFVKLYDKKGAPVLQDIFRLVNGFASGDLLIPDDLPKDVYFLIAHTSSPTAAPEITTRALRIDPEYSNQWVAETSLKDSISISGQKNEIALTLSDLSGEIQKNEQLRYQLMNGTEIFEKGKLKTDEKGKAVIRFTLPAKTNRESFICKISDSKDEWSKEIFLPTNLDQVIVRFFPEGGTLNTGIPARIGFTAFNPWGMPVDVEGTVVNPDNKPIILVKSFTKGLGLFSLMNDGNQKYKLVLSGKTGQNQTFDLPDPKPDGMALSAVKSDAGFISASLIFADKQKHSIAIAITSGNKLNWAAEMDINGIGRIKIPDENLPQGINLLSVFSAEGMILAERIVFVDKKQQLKLEVVPEKNKLQSGESMKVKVRMTDENNQPLSGNVTVAVSGPFRNDVSGHQPEDCPSIGSELETPYSVLSGASKGRIVNPVLMDVYLIANRIRGFNWETIKTFKPENAKALAAKAKDFDAQISHFIAANSLKYSVENTDHQADRAYFSNNPELFEKTPAKAKPNTNSLDRQHNLLSATTNLLDVIKILKPYTIINNQIVFNGSGNSINFQGGALFVLDGQRLGTDISALSIISPLQVDHINISTNPADIQKYTGFNSVGVIEIFLKNGKMLEPEAKKENANKYQDGFRVPNVFPGEQPNLKHDTRTTLLWAPNQKMDGPGIFEFTVTGGKVVSDFMIEVHGISRNGRTGCGSSAFSVVK